jgi:hypothetical protein
MVCSTNSLSDYVKYIEMIIIGAHKADVADLRYHFFIILSTISVEIVGGPNGFEPGIIA